MFRRTSNTTIWWNFDKNAQSTNDCPPQTPQTYYTYTIPGDKKETFMQVTYTTDPDTNEKKLVLINTSDFRNGTDGAPIPQYNYSDCTGEWDMSKCKCISYSDDWPCP